MWCQVACGSGLALIYEFLLTDELANQPLLRNAKPKVGERGGLCGANEQPHPAL